MTGVPEQYANGRAKHYCEFSPQRYSGNSNKSKLYAPLPHISEHGYTQEAAGERKAAYAQPFRPDPQPMVSGHDPRSRGRPKPVSRSGDADHHSLAGQIMWCLAVLGIIFFIGHVIIDTATQRERAAKMSEWPKTVYGQNEVPKLPRRDLGEPEIMQALPR